MSLINVNNVLSGLSHFGIDSDLVSQNLEREVTGETLRALEDYVIDDIETKIDRSAVILDETYPGSN